MKKKTIVTLFWAVLAAALLLRLAGLERSFVLDEFRTIKFASLPVSSIFGAIHVDSYPPFSYLLLHYWLNVSRSDVWIRILFIIFGMLSVITVYHLGKKLVNREYALLAMFVMAIMPMQIWISQYARGIGPAILFCLLSALSFFYLIENGERGFFDARGISYILSSVFAIYSFYFSFFLIAAQNIIYIWRYRLDPKRISRWMVLQAMIALLFIPWLIGFIGQLKDANIIENYTMVKNIGFVLAGVQVGVYLRSISGLFGLDQAFLMNTAITKSIQMNAMVLAMFIAITLLGLATFLSMRLVRNLSSWKESRTPVHGIPVRERFFILLIFAFLPFAASVLLNLIFRAPMTPRYFAVSAAFMAFVYAFYLYLLKNKKLLYLLIAALVIGSLLRMADFTQTIIDYKLSSRFVSRYIANGEVLLFTGGEGAYSYYCSLPEHFISTKDYIKSYGIGASVSLDSLVNKGSLLKHLDGFGAVWVYGSGEQMAGIMRYVTGIIEDIDYHKVGEYRFKGIEIYKYAKKSL